MLPSEGSNGLSLVGLRGARLLFASLIDDLVGTRTFEVEPLVCPPPQGATPLSDLNMTALLAEPHSAAHALLDDNWSVHARIIVAGQVASEFQLSCRRRLSESIIKSLGRSRLQILA